LRHNDAFVLKFFPNDEFAAVDGKEEEGGRRRRGRIGRCLVGGDRLIDRVTQFPDDSRRERDGEGEGEREREREREREIPPTS